MDGLLRGAAEAAVRLSVCIPTHHGRRALLEEALESVAAQVSPELGVEVVVSSRQRVARRHRPDGGGVRGATSGLTVVYGVTTTTCGWPTSRAWSNALRETGAGCSALTTPWSRAASILWSGPSQRIRKRAASPGPASNFRGPRPRDRIAGAAPEVTPPEREITSSSCAGSRRSWSSSPSSMASWAATSCGAIAGSPRPWARQRRPSPPIRPGRKSSSSARWRAVIPSGSGSRRSSFERVPDGPTWWRVTPSSRISRMHVLLVDGLHGAWADVAGADTALYRG